MKFGSSDSSVSMMSAYAEGELQAMLCGMDEEDSARIAEKKRRLSENQVKLLEKNFEVDNKLQPERKVKLAKELGLQPRQIAVWFQNRRARWKTKQLESEYLLLKSNYDALKLNRENLRRENESLVREIKDLKSKLGARCSCGDLNAVEMNDEIAQKREVSAEVIRELKDGSSDSDASAVLQEENGSYGVSSIDFVDSSSTSSRRFGSSCSSMEIFQFSQKDYVPEFAKEERDLIGGDDCYSFFSGEQSGTLPWFGSDQWN